MAESWLNRELKFPVSAELDSAGEKKSARAAGCFCARFAWALNEKSCREQNLR